MIAVKLMQETLLGPLVQLDCKAIKARSVQPEQLVLAVMAEQLE